MTINRYRIRGKRVPIPHIATSKVQPQPIDYRNGLYRGDPNDSQPKHTLPYVNDMRFNGRGKYKSRKGCSHFSVAVGEAINVQITSTAGATDAAYNTTTWIAEKVTAAASGVLSRIDIKLKNSINASGATIIEVFKDHAGVPSEKVAWTSLSPTAVVGSYVYLTAYTMQCPTITNGQSYWIVVRLQESGQGSMYASTTTASTNAKISTNAGQSWAPAGFSLNVKLYTATDGGVKGNIRIKRPNGQIYTFFAHGTSVYSVDEATGATTVVDANGISASSTFVRFCVMKDTLYYVDGIGKPRKYNYTSASEVSSAPQAARNIIEHMSLLWFMNAGDNNSGYYSNFADPEVFTSTDFFNVPAPNTSDRLTAWEKLNGVLYFFSRNNKYMVMGEDTATFRNSEAYAQKGTFSQESLVADENFIYFASDDGVYKFNGTSEKNILEGLIIDYENLLYKDDIHLDLYNNRLYIWYRPNGMAEVNKCIVYNTLYDVIESEDSNTYIGRSYARKDMTNRFVQASNRAGVLYFGEERSNDYNNLGSAIEAEARTAYDHFGTPQQRKRITYWRPILESVQGNYSLQAGFAADYSDDVTYTNVPLQGMGFRYDSITSLYDAATYASGRSSSDTTLNIFGSAVRWQRRYKHHAAYEPIEFSGEVLKVETERLR